MNLLTPGLLKYVVSMKRANSHCFDVSLRVNPREPIRAPLKLMMPVWTPGHYSVDEFSRNVLEVKATARVKGGDSKPARVAKEAKNVWKVEWNGLARVLEVKYSVFAFEYHDTKSYLDSFHALINGASVFMFPVDMAASSIGLKLVPFSGWKRASTGLEHLGEWEFAAPDIDVLIDSPIEVGNQETHSFRIGNIEHEVSIFGEATLDREKFVDDLRRIVEAETGIFRQIPYRRYVFLVNFTDEIGGGLEHLNSTVCFVQRLRLFPKEEYNLMLGLFSHEFFHTWNVKRMRPWGLGPFNYSAETYTKSLWIAEGITSYYDDLVLRRTGAYTVPEYLDAFAININQLMSLPGSRFQSAEEASFDAWIKYYRQDANSPNVTMSYYTQGAVIGWMLDLQIRENSMSRLSLDDVMRRVYETTYVKEGRYYTNEEFEAVATEVGGNRGMKEIFEKRVRGRADVDFGKYLGYAGLKLEPKEKPNRTMGFMGIRLGTDGGKTTVKTRLAGSPAEAMGISTGDEVIAVDGFRLGPDTIPFYISNQKPGTRVKILGARNGTLLEFTGALGKRPTFEHRIIPLEKATERQRSVFRNWLLEDWRPELKHTDYTKSPDRKTTLDFV